MPIIMLILIIMLPLNLIALIWCLVTQHQEKRARLENENSAFFAFAPDGLKQILRREKRSHIFLALGIAGLLFDIVFFSIPLLLCPAFCIASGVRARNAGKLRAELRLRLNASPENTAAAAAPAAAAPGTPDAAREALELEFQKSCAAELRQKQRELQDIDMLGR